MNTKDPEQKPSIQNHCGGNQQKVLIARWL